MSNMIELRGVTKRFGSFVAVDNVDLEIGSGEFLTLLGPSGCGKTTLLRMISGFEYPTLGQVYLDGVDVTDRPPYERNVNQVFQSYALFPHLSVRENIAFGLRVQKIPYPEMDERIAAAVEMVSLKGFEDRKPAQLSGGQKQRVALARAIVCRPKVLLLDEPLSALDAKLRKSMQLELKRLQERLGITFVYVTHDQEEALTMSDRIAVVNNGKIEQFGSVNDIYHRPRSSFVANFIGQTNLLEARIIDRMGSMARIALDGIEMVAVADGLPADVREAMVSIRPEKIQIYRVHPRAENTFRAKVEVELFKGAVDQLMLKTDSGLELTALVANKSDFETSLHKNDEVFCRIDCDDIVVVQSDGNVPVA